MSASVKPSARDAIQQIANVLAPIGVAYDAKLPVVAVRTCLRCMARAWPRYH